MEKMLKLNLLRVQFKKRKQIGFSLIELMIAVAIVGIIAAVAIPAYQAYLRRSYLSETTQSFSAIKSAEESFFTVNNCYVEAPVWPSSIPSGGTPVTWDNGSVPAAWQRSVLGVRPDRQVRFQYQVYATNSLLSGGCGTAAPVALPTNLDCLQNAQTTLVPSSMFPSNWYVVVARGNLSGGSGNSTIISAIDDSSVIMCNELR